jgi:hypothetical protein
MAWVLLVLVVGRAGAEAAEALEQLQALQHTLQHCTNTPQHAQALTLSEARGGTPTPLLGLQHTLQHTLEQLLF